MELLKRLQARPEKEKISILRISVAVTVILILVIWVLTLKYRTIEQGDTTKFQKIWNNVRELKSKFKNQNGK